MPNRSHHEEDVAELVQEVVESLEASSASYFVLGFDLNVELSPELLDGVGLMSRKDLEHDERHLSIVDLTATYDSVAAKTYQSEGDR